MSAAIPYELLENIRDAEQREQTLFNSWLKPATITTTDRLADVAIVTETQEETVFSFNLKNGVWLLLPFLLVGLIVALSDRSPQGLIVPGLLFSFAFFVFYLRYRKRNKVAIKINCQGIETDAGMFLWQDIAATAILRSPRGQFSTSFLIIILKDNSFYKRAFTSLVSEKRLSSYIEYFKAKAVAEV
ncbi:hypothetical protein ACTHGU_07380 [Chitinophagaceae bacterium MMS25-I14]